MGEVMEIGSLINRLPNDIINYIIPYTYNFQNKELLEDIKNYNKTKCILYNYYYNLWINFYGENEPEDKYWLINDLIAYSNDYHATMNGYVNKFYNIWHRNFFFKTREEIDIYFEKIQKKEVESQINILLGLMMPEERDEVINYFHVTKEAVIIFLLE
jgi:hypothetical protein